MLLKPWLAREGAVNQALSQESCHRPSRRWAQGCSRPGPRDLFVLKQSPYRLFFQCPLYFLVSYLQKCWGAVGCSLCSSVDWVGVSLVWRGKWTPLPPILWPSFLVNSYSILFYSILFYSILLYSTLFHSIPFHSIPFHSIPFH